MPPTSPTRLFVLLDNLIDPRNRKGQRHDMTAMIIALICATLCGVRGLKPIARWVRSQEPSTWHWLGFKWKPPCANCYADLLKAIDPVAFEQAIREWVASLDGLEIDDETLRTVSIDGKTLRGTLEPHQRAIHLLAAFDHQTGYMLHQLQMDPATNEHKAALELLKGLVLKGKVIVGDAMFCQRDVCEQILDSGGDYFLVIKENQPQLRRDVELSFADSSAFSPLPTA